MNVAHAMGRRDGDELTLSNQWARVTVMRDSASEYLLTGDAQGTYRTLKEAMNAALECLALYERGRAD